MKKSRAILLPLKLKARRKIHFQKAVLISGRPSFRRKQARHSLGPWFPHPRTQEMTRKPFLIPNDGIHRPAFSSKIWNISRSDTMTGSATHLVGFECFPQMERPRLRLRGPDERHYGNLRTGPDTPYPAGIQPCSAAFVFPRIRLQAQVTDSAFLSRWRETLGIPASREHSVCALPLIRNF